MDVMKVLPGFSLDSVACRCVVVSYPGGRR